MTMLDSRPVVTQLDLDEPPPAASTRPSASRFAVLMTPQAPILIAVGLVVLGFGLLAYTWVRVSTLKIVAAQLPYVISGGLSGLGCVVFGAALLLIGARRNDDAARARQDAALVRALTRIEAAMAGDARSEFTVELPKI